MASKTNIFESVKELFLENDLNFALNKILKTEKKDLNQIKIINDLLLDNKIIDKIKNENDIILKKEVKLFVYSRIMAFLSFYNKKQVLDKFLSSFTEKERKQIALYEYKNKSDITINNKIFDKYCLKYKINFSDFPNKSKLLELTQQINIYNKIITNPKKSKIFKKIFIISVLLISISFFGFNIYKYSKFNSKYKNLIYKGIYLNDINLEGKKKSDVKKIIDNEKNNILDKKIIFHNINGDYEYTYKDLNIKIDDNLSSKIFDYNKKLSFFDKLMIINSNKKTKIFTFDFLYNKDDITNFINRLKNDVNKEVRNDAIIRNENYEVYYDSGINGFVLDDNDINNKIEKLLEGFNDNKVIELKGEITKKEITKEHLSSIDTKISSYTTTFSNYGNRGNNVTLAASRLNGSILMPNEEFSYTKVVGPYTYQIGFKDATAYINGEISSAIGGGVCQVSSTLYNAYLRAGLTTVSRKNHIFAQDYVPPGLDATIYSNDVDLKFKNELKYPVYISSYVIGGKLTVDIWSNSEAIKGKKFEPYAVYSNGGYHTYLKIYENDTLVETKYLNSSYYKSHY